MTARYLPTPSGVDMISNGGPVSLTLEQADQLLGIYEEAGARREFNDLYEAASAHPLFIPRPSSFRKARAA
jgi:hypothetical protein